MKKIQVSYLFENAGLCTDVFKSVDSPHRFYNRNTESGIWYTAPRPHMKTIAVSGRM